MAKRRLKRAYRRTFFSIFLLIILVVATFGGLWAWGEYAYRYDNVVLSSETLKIYEKDSSLASVAKLLENEGVIASAEKFLDIAASRNFTTLKAGNYRFEVGESYRQLFNKLRFAHESPIRVTFNNIRTKEQLAGVLSKAFMADSLQFIECLKTKDISHFIPNTYECYWSDTPEEFSAKMESEYQKFWSNTTRTDRATQLGFSPEEIVIIASIVDEETNAVSEMTDVAGVYINRLRIGMPLQADPTVKYAMGDFTIRRVLTKHLEYDSPYNTYKYAGLPPTPICSPSIAAIDATLSYASAPHKYYYFCANADFSGTHKFASSLSQHNANARAYQRELSRRGIK